MKKISLSVPPGEFVRRLACLQNIWKRTSGKAPSARRHRRSLKRRWIRLYKRANGISALPFPAGTLSDTVQWFQPDVTELKLVYLPQEETSADNPTPAWILRKDLRRLIWEGVERGRQTSVDLVSAANASAKTLPNVAETTLGDTRRMRGIFLEALGAAILPELSAEEIDRLEKAGARVLDNTPFATIAPTDTLPGRTPLSNDWHLTKINAAAAWRRGLDGSGIVIGVLDTGIDAGHPEFAGKSIRFRAFSSRGYPARDQTVKDYRDHGTHVAAICAGRTVGLARRADLVVAAVLTEKIDNKLVGYPTQIAAGLNWMTAESEGRLKNVDVINASFGGPLQRKDEYYSPVEANWRFSTLTIAAIGNNGRKGEGNHCAPAMFDIVLSVGAVDHRDVIAPSSAWGQVHSPYEGKTGYKPDLVAPGIQIYSAVPGSAYRRFDGTSMACPLVTGAAALLMQHDASLKSNADLLKERLLGLTCSSGKNVHTSESYRYGRGRLDLANI